MNLHKLYNFYTLFFYTLYVALLFGISFISNDYLNKFTSFVKVLISITLIYLFNPFRKKTDITLFEKDIVFSSGIYLLLTTFIGEHLLNYEKQLQNVIKKKLTNL